MVVYIAGKMTGLEDLGRDHFARAEKALRAQGHVVLNPASLPDGLQPSAYMPICSAMIDAADAVFLLDNWPASRGASLEKAYAEYQGKEILYEAPDPGRRISAAMDMVGAMLAGFGGQA